MVRKYLYKKNYEFKEKVARFKKERLFGVSIDPSKSFHHVLVFDFSGKLLVDPFRVDTLQSGYKKLKDNIRKATRKRLTDDIYIAVEDAGIYSSNLLRSLDKDYKNVVVISPGKVCQNRKQQSLGNLKTDDVDAGAIGDLLIRGEFREYVSENVDYYYLRELVYWRDKKVGFRISLKNQINARIDRIFPGLNSDFEDNKPVFIKQYESRLHRGLLSLQKTPQELLKISDKKLMELMEYGRNNNEFRVRRLKNRLKEMILVDEDLAKNDLKLLKRDVQLFNSVENNIGEVEELIEEFVCKTPAKYLIGQFRGLSTLLAGIYIGILGDITKYESASHVFSMSGLSPKISESGGNLLKPSKVSRQGNKLLRRTLFQMARQVIMQDPFFNEYYHAQKEKNKKHWKKQFIAVANKLNKVMFALMRDKSTFDPLKATSKNPMVS